MTSYGSKFHSFLGNDRTSFFIGESGDAKPPAAVMVIKSLTAPRRSRSAARLRR